jgi:hypothetical protein
VAGVGRIATSGVSGTRNGGPLVGDGADSGGDGDDLGGGVAVGTVGDGGSARGDGVGLG